MRAIHITFKDPAVLMETFRHKGRAGGSYTISVRYEPGWVVVQDEYGNEQAFPSLDVRRVETEEDARW